jgi:hypothetical protein
MTWGGLVEGNLAHSAAANAPGPATGLAKIVERRNQTCEVMCPKMGRVTRLFCISRSVKSDDVGKGCAAAEISALY